jgi:hypothetical protein
MHQRRGRADLSYPAVAAEITIEKVVAKVSKFGYFVPECVPRYYHALGRNTDMRRIAVAGLMLVIVAGPLFAKTHQDIYPVSCTVLWSAVKDTIRNSGKYGILGMDSTEMTASYSIGIGALGQKRINSVVLNVKGDSSCEMVTQSGYSGLGNNDAGDFKKRVDASLAKLQASPPPAAPAKPENTPAKSDNPPAKSDSPKQ